MTEQSPSDRLNRASNDILDATSFLYGANAAFLEGLYAQYLADPASVEESWRTYFADLGEQGLNATQLGRGPAWQRDRKPAAPGRSHPGAERARPPAAQAPCRRWRRRPRQRARIPSTPSNWCAPIASSVISRPISIR